mmetsp:Transcript_29433/g.75562  ORF Transcript_29433/g.75562 Transcript_29433/m.75562 type:complete len:215 (-) Transcript_29433:48-692(-)
MAGIIFKSRGLAVCAACMSSGAIRFSRSSGSPLEKFCGEVSTPACLAILSQASVNSRKIMLRFSSLCICRQNSSVLQMCALVSIAVIQPPGEGCTAVSADRSTSMVCLQPSCSSVMIPSWNMRSSTLTAISVRLACPVEVWLGRLARYRTSTSRSSAIAVCLVLRRMLGWAAFGPLLWIWSCSRRLVRGSRISSHGSVSTCKYSIRRRHAVRRT